MMIPTTRIGAGKELLCSVLILWLAIVTWADGAEAGAEPDAAMLDPRGETHIPIGIANTLDSLKTFVEAEGIFSPGVGTYGIYFWVYDRATAGLFAPTMSEASCEHGLAEGGYLIPWSEWSAGDIKVRTTICHALRDSPAGPVHAVGARVVLGNGSDQERAISLYAALRPLGPAGFDVRHLSLSNAGEALLVDDRAALVARQEPTRAGVVQTDTIGHFALRGTVPDDRAATSADGNCSGALSFAATLGPGASTTFEFVCPVLPGRRAVRHRWDGVSEWAQFDLAGPDPTGGGVLQPDPGLAYYRTVAVGHLFEEARTYWKELVGGVELHLPEPRWSAAFAAMAAHAAMAMNEGAPDVAVVNYNVFNRDGVYVANILQKAGRTDLAAEAIEYFLDHPFNGRSYPEADNPGQILWIMAEHWRFTRDRAWLARVYPAAEKLAAMIRYYRTTDGPHWVRMDALAFGEDIGVDKRRELKPGRCDGHNPAYTEAFDLAGIRAAATLAQAIGKEDDALGYARLAEDLSERYDHSYGDKLADKYGSYCVLWPCRLYPFARGTAHEQFRGLGAQEPKSWRYFPLARAHQSLLAGNREAGYETLHDHLDHPQMRRWYAFDEGGKSGSGGWHHLRTTWNGSVAMPHGWAIAEVHLLLRDCLVYEDGRKLVLFAGVPESWFTHPDGMEIGNLPTHFGSLTATWEVTGSGAILRLDGSASPPDGFILSLPASLRPTVSAQARTSERTERGFALPGETRNAHIRFAQEDIQ